MNIRGNKVTGLKVITLNDGAEVGKVKDIIYDPHIHTVRALYIDDGGWFSDAKVILIQDVHSIGEDAVIIESREMIKKASDVPDPISNIASNDQYLTKTKIITENGTTLGTVSDLFFDTKTGLVSEFEVTQGIFQNAKSGKKRVKVNDIVTIGKDATIVRGFTEDKFDEQAKNQGISGALHTSREKSKNIASDAYHKAVDIRDNAAENIKKVQNDPDNRAVLEDIKNKAANLADKAKNEMDKIRSRTDEAGSAPEINDARDALKLQAQRAKSAVKDLSDKTQEKINRQADEYRNENAADSTEYITKPEEDTTVTETTEDEIIIPDRQDPSQYRPYGTLGGKSKVEKNTESSDTTDES